MIYTPKFSIGSKVVMDKKIKGEIRQIQAEILIDEGGAAWDTYYLVEHLSGDVSRVLEHRLADDKEINNNVSKDLDHFLADSLLLSRHLDPDRVDNSINKLLNGAEGDKDGKHHEGSL